MRRLRILQIFSRYIHFGGEESFVDSFRSASLPYHDVTDYQGSTEELFGRSFSSKLTLPVRAFHNSKVAKDLSRLQKKAVLIYGSFKMPFLAFPHLSIKLLLISKFRSFTISTTIGWAVPTVFS